MFRKRRTTTCAGCGQDTGHPTAVVCHRCQYGRPARCRYIWPRRAFSGTFRPWVRCILGEGHRTAHQYDTAREFTSERGHWLTDEELAERAERDDRDARRNWLQ